VTDYTNDDFKLGQEHTDCDQRHSSILKKAFDECFSEISQPSIDCHLTVLMNNRGHATKVFALDDSGHLQKRSAANIFEGLAKRITIRGLDKLRDHLEKMPSRCAFCFGVTDKKEARLLTQETLRSGSYPDAIARDRDHFSFREGQPGVLMLDCDAREGQLAMNWQDIDQILAEIIPDWLPTQRLWRASSSSFIYAIDGSEVIGMGSWRCYVMVDDASAIPSVGAYIYQRLWETGHGHIFISQSGQALDRSLIDASVWQPERIDFAAEPVLASGLLRRAPKPILLGSTPLLATAGIVAPQTLAKWRQSSDVLRRAKEAASQECEETRSAYIATRVKALKREFPQASEKHLHKLMRQAIEHHVLSRAFVLYRSDGSSITVGEILADSEKWHQARFADPLEPKYRNDSRIAYANLDPAPGSNPYLFSHAHGGMHYRLVLESESASDDPNHGESRTGQNQGAGEGRKPKAADILIGLADEAELYHAPDGTAYADLPIKDHRETCPVRSKGFKRWLSRRYYEETEGAPNSEALQSAFNVIEAKAHYDGPEHEVHVRVAGLDGRIYLDLADDDWCVIEIDEDGWRVEDAGPVRFRRAAGMLPLPMPERGGSVDTLRTFLNVSTEEEFVLAVTWILAAIRNEGPYPILALSGEQGSAKSTFCAILRSLVDPNCAALRALPREDRDLFIAATNAHILAFDNVSRLSPWIADTLCRLATGGGFAVRQLYTDGDEVLFSAQRPVILNGIEDVVERSDLADRALFLTLEPIAEDRRRPEQELWSEFERERPRILGALLDAVAAGLRALPDVKLDSLPRMADFAIWATACESALWPKGTFADAYESNRDSAIETVIENDPVSNGIRQLMDNREVWAGTATKLLDDLCQHVDERLRNNRRWPSDPKALSGRLRRGATFLRTVGVHISHERENDRNRTRIIRIEKLVRENNIFNFC